MGLPTASDNPFPSLLVTEGSAPAAPPAGKKRLYIDSADHHLKTKDSASAIVDLQTAAGLSDQGVFTYLDGTVAAAPGTPASGKLRLYAKTGKVLAVKDDAGAETVLGSGGVADQGAFTYFDATDGSAPANPASGYARIYSKSGRIYSRDSSGTEYGPFDAAGGGDARDDDFTASVLDAKWVTLGSLDTLNTTDTPGTLHMANTSIGYAVNGILEAATPPFMVMTKITAWTLASNYVQAGILLADSTPTALRTFGPLYGGYGAAVNDLAFGLWTNRTSRASNTDANLSMSAPFWLAPLAVSATSVAAYYSTNGTTWVEYSIPVAAGFTIAKAGLFLAGNTSGGAAGAYFEKIKFLALA